MKRLLLALLLLPLCSFCQDSLLLSVFPIKEGKVQYEQVIEVPGATKDDLYSRAKSWALTYYNSQKDALQLDDKQAGIVAYKGFFTMSYEGPKMSGMSVPSTFQYWQVIKIFAKDGKAKIVVNDILVRQKVHTTTIVSTYDEGVPLESFVYNLQHPNTDMYQGLGKRKMDQYVIEDAKKKLAQMPAVNRQIRTIMATIESYLAGIKKAESDF